MRFPILSGLAEEELEFPSPLWFVGLVDEVSFGYAQQPVNSRSNLMPPRHRTCLREHLNE